MWRQAPTRFTTSRIRRTASRHQELAAWKLPGLSPGQCRSGHRDAQWRVPWTYLNGGIEIAQPDAREELDEIRARSLVAGRANPFYQAKIRGHHLTLQL